MPRIISKGDEEGLRKVEKDVLIMKRVKEKGFEICADVVKEFEDCMRGRTVSAAWKCRQQNRTMQDCLIDKFKDPSIYEQCKEEYLKEREQFRATGTPVRKVQKAAGSCN